MKQPRTCRGFIDFFSILEGDPPWRSCKESLPCSSATNEWVTASRDGDAVPAPDRRPGRAGQPARVRRWPYRPDQSEPDRSKWRPRRRPPHRSAQPASVPRAEPQASRAATVPEAAPVRWAWAPCSTRPPDPSTARAAWDRWCTARSASAPHRGRPHS